MKRKIANEGPFHKRILENANELGWKYPNALVKKTYPAGAWGNVDEWWAFINEGGKLVDYYIGDIPTWAGTSSRSKYQKVRKELAGYLKKYPGIRAYYIQEYVTQRTDPNAQ